MKTTSLAQDAFVQEATSNRVYTDNPQEKEDFVEVTSKDKESESTEVDSLFSLLSL